METGLVRFLVSVWFGNIWRIFLNKEPVVLRDGENIYGDRYQLRTDFADDIFTLIIFNATYNDSGNYSVEVGVKPGGDVVDVATVNVHGMFFSVIVSD